MPSTSYYLFPEQAHIGFGVAKKTGTEAKNEKARHIFLVADPHVLEAGVVQPVIQSIQEARLSLTLYDKVQPNPESTSVDASVDAFRASGADSIVAVGGGSALDTAKTMRIVLGGPTDGKVAEYAYRLGDKARPHPKNLPYFIAIPTTAGTGSEATPWGVLTDPSDKIKFGVGGVRGLPNVALVDPELMLGLPPFLTAATGMDALSHNIEAFVSTNQNPILDAMILHGIRLVAQSLPTAVSNGSHKQARLDMANAAYIGGVAITSKWLGACHSLAHQLSGFANVQHGLANAIMLPHQMAYSLAAALDKYAQIGDALGVVGETTSQRAERAVEAIHRLNNDIGLPSRLRDVGVKEEMIKPMAHAAFHNDLNWQTNPREVSEAVMEQLYQDAF